MWGLGPPGSSYDAARALHERISLWGHNLTRKCGDLGNSPLKSYRCQDGSLWCQLVRFTYLVSAGSTAPLLVDSQPLFERSVVRGEPPMTDEDLQKTPPLIMGLVGNGGE
jgi:hypothetical protein